EYITPGVEIVEIEPDDTSRTDGKKVIRRKLLLTSFDEDAYKIPEQTIKVGGKEYKTNPLALKVLTVDVDTTNVDAFFPPKDVQDNPFLWSEWSGLFWLSVVMFFLIVIGLYLYIRYKQHKPIISRIMIVRHIPPHQKALTAIEKIKQEKIYNASDQKEYYTRLTDTLRLYIEERFGFSAMEMTSGEIIARLRTAGDAEMIGELRSLFEVADLVKFAKYSALINENDLNLVNAINFIDRTKTQETEREERIVPKLSETDKRVEESRKVIKILLGVIIVAVVFILCYVIYGVMLLF
ncbi:MAG: BatD family protein, partial [Prevotella sp.]|nr:BatD family protein [Prevotella sp.]